VVATVISTLREDGFRFVKLDKKSLRYYEIGDHLAHEKTGHALRDLLKVWGRSKSRSPNFYDLTEDPLHKKTGHATPHHLLNIRELSDKQPKRCYDVNASEDQAHETGNAVRDLLELRNRLNRPSTMVVGLPSTMAVADPNGRRTRHSFDLESHLGLPSTMVVASPRSRTCSYGLVGGSDLDSTTVMMGRGRGKSRLLRMARTHRRSFVVCFPSKW
jgi:hypothetical protein